MNQIEKNILLDYKTYEISDYFNIILSFYIYD
jgi:hypothetical protein